MQKQIIILITLLNLGCGLFCQNCDRSLGCLSCFEETNNENWDVSNSTNVESYISNFQTCQCTPIFCQSLLISSRMFLMFPIRSWLFCQEGYYIDKNGYFNVSAALYQDICQPNVQPNLCLFAASKFECDTCIYGYSTYQIGNQSLCYQCLNQNGDLLKTLRCTLFLDGSSNSISQQSKIACLNGYVDKTTDQCVTNCGLRKRVQILQERLLSCFDRWEKYWNMLRKARII
ncbi:UNKNOWN [Stylonychia lemnae]|uniref:Transmembrane protein n=1 Tax=Stylonychia lemnae TaxID=5949 RepID=A0A078AUH9_STYLE|nr:UNKNOWN [Stylonychia lemnae]|eukprot:CDW84528.1 UNKNOWN [Stylonychia lemnae]